MAINVTADSIVITVSAIVYWSQSPAAGRDPALDITLDNISTPVYVGIAVSITGSWFNVGIIGDPIVITLTPLADFPVGVLVAADSIDIAIGIVSSDIFLGPNKSNWIQWSNIGSLVFTIGRDNVAGERPLDWKGQIYVIRKLGDRVVAYGENGVSILKPSSRQYGLKTISKIGLYSINAVTGDEDVHYFIDILGQLWKLGDSLELLDYSEFFSAMSSLVMSYDAESGAIYICDGNYGYVYSIKNKSLGRCSPNITGIGSRDGTLYVASAGAIDTPTFEICTDIYDLGTRKFKTVKSVEVGTDLTESMQASIDYRVSNKVAFSSLGWSPVNLEGISYLSCYGLEFRFKLRVQTYEYFEIDYFKINGQIHNYSYTEHMLSSINEQRRIIKYGS